MHLGNWCVDDKSKPLGIIDSLYFSIVTITTLGYGDITPIRDAQKVFVVLEALFGILTFGLLLTWIGREMADKQQKVYEAQEQARRDRKLMGVFVSIIEQLETLTRYFDCTHPKDKSMYRFSTHVFDGQSVSIEKTYYDTDSLITILELKKQLPFCKVYEWVSLIRLCKNEIRSTIDSSDRTIEEFDIRQQIEDFMWVAESTISSLKSNHSDELSEDAVRLLGTKIDALMNETYLFKNILLNKADDSWDEPDKHRDIARQSRLESKHENTT